MTNPTTELQNWIGRTMTGESGDKIGTIGDVYVDEETGRPEWLAVTTGMFGSRVSFVPLRGCTADGDEIRSSFTKAQVKDAPHAEPDGRLEPAEEEALYRHYGMEWGSSGKKGDGRRNKTEGRDTSGPTTDSAMTRSEEELKVGVQSQETGRARLRKYVVTEQEQVTVPVQHEEVRIEREPITEANVDAAMDGPDISEEEHEVVLREERPVVEKKTVPKERVRLDKETVTDQETVAGEVRKERIDVDEGSEESVR